MSKPAGTTAVSGQTIESAKYNSTIDDIIDDLNAARPVVAGGTGATTAAAAQTALEVPGLSANNTFSGANTFSGVNTFSATVKWAKGADVASATALTLGNDGNYFDITGTTTITSIVTKGVGTVVKLHFDAALVLTHHATDLILPGGANITTAAGDEAEFIECAIGDWRCLSYQKAVSPPAIITPWVAYTPTFTGFGTPSGVSVFSRRVGDTLEIQGRFTAGTTTATEARVTLGFNGTDGSITSDATKVASIRLCGLVTYDQAMGTIWVPVTLIESNVGYITFGNQSTSNGGLSKSNGNIVAGTGWVVSFTASVPISGW